jgi:hypothetical protein
VLAGGVFLVGGIIDIILAMGSVVV